MKKALKYILITLALLLFTAGALVYYYVRSATHIEDFTLNFKEGNIIIQSRVDFKANDGSSLLKIQDLSIKLGTEKIFKNLSVPMDVVINNLSLNLDQGVSFNDRILDTLVRAERSKFFHINKLDIKDSVISKKGVAYNINSNRNDDVYSVVLENLSSKTASSITFKQNDIFIERLPIWFLQNIIPANYQNPFIEKLTGKDVVSGSIVAVKKEKPQEPDFILKLESEKRPGAAYIALEAQSAYDFQLFNITSMDLVLPNNSGAFHTTGSLSNHDGIFFEDVGLVLDVTVKNSLMSNAQTLWPYGVVQDTRLWIAKSFKTGMINDASVKVSIKDIFSAVSKDDVAAWMTFEDLTLKYNEDHPDLTKLKGKAVFDAEKVVISVNEGKIYKSDIFDSTVSINYHEDLTPLDINVHTKGRAVDYIGYIPAENIKEMEGKGVAINKILGSLSGNVKINIPLAKDVVLHNMNIDINADLEKTHLEYLKKISVDGDLKLKMSNKSLSLIGTPAVDGKPATFNLVTNFEPNPDFDTKLHLNFITKLDTPLNFANNRIQISGVQLPVDFLYTYKTGFENITVDADFEKAQIDIPDISLQKKVSIPALFHLKLVKHNDGPWSSDKIEFVSKDINITAYLEMDSKFEKMNVIDCRVSAPRNNFKLHLIEDEKHSMLQVQGSEIYLGNTKLLKLIDSSSFDSDRKLLMSLQLDKAVMKNDTVFSNIVGNLECQHGKCANSLLKIKMNDKDNVKITLHNKNERNVWTFTTNNAASFLKALGVYQNIAGGNLTIKLTNSKEKNSVFVGEMHMENFRAFKTPLIAKLIWLTPFTQIVQLLQDDDLIKFDTLEGHFLITDKDIKINRSIAIGDVITATFEGSIDLQDYKIDLHGKLIPNYLINKATHASKDFDSASSSKISTEYEIRGNLEDPRISVNPLSALVSLLMKLPFGIF